MPEQYTVEVYGKAAIIFLIISFVYSIYQLYLWSDGDVDLPQIFSAILSPIRVLAIFGTLIALALGVIGVYNYWKNKKNLDILHISVVIIMTVLALMLISSLQEIFEYRPIQYNSPFGGGSENCSETEIFHYNRPSIAFISFAIIGCIAFIVVWMPIALLILKGLFK